MARAAAWAALVVVFGACGGGGKGGPADAAAIVEQQDGGPEPSDAGTPPDAAVQPPDAGAPGPDASIVQPTSQGWTFYGVSAQVFGATMDEGGNLWVAGGQNGLYLMKAGSKGFQRFGLAEGLHPYGAPYVDETPVTDPYLDVLSVSGGPAGTVFVGYRGRPGNAPGWECEDDWYRNKGGDGGNPDPNVYKSGDADRVTLSGSGIEVFHYDISSPKGTVGDEPDSREKVCTIWRILYDKSSQSVWFGGNHAYAWGDPLAPRERVPVVQEHAHPLLNGHKTMNSPGEVALTGDYYGLAVQTNGDLWVGGLHRSQLCQAGMAGAGFWDCEEQGTLPDGRYALDWWPDALHVDNWPSQRVEDRVSAMSVAPDGTLWIGSFTNGLAHRKADGSVEFFTTGLIDPQHVSSVAVDPLDGSVWVGATKGGLTRIQSGVFTRWDGSVLGSRANSEITDIQVDRSQAQRRIIVSFKSGSVGVYDGP